MANASINFKPVQSNSEHHNERKAKLHYSIPELESQNEHWQSERIGPRMEACTKLYEEKVGQKMQTKTAIIREAVVNLNPEHKTEDLQRLAQALKSKYGIDCFQISIHRDEGRYVDSEDKTLFTRTNNAWKDEKGKKVDPSKYPEAKLKINYHGHMVFDWQDKETGKTFKHNKIAMSQIQTLVAETLGMKRGELKTNSNTQRLEAVEYKREQEAKRLEELKQEVELLEQKKNRAVQDNDEARAEHERALSESRELDNRKQGKISLSKQRSTQLGTKGIQSDNELSRWPENDIKRAIEWQCREIERLEQDIRGQQGDIRAVQQETRDVENEPENAQIIELYRKLEADRKRLEREIS